MADELGTKDKRRGWLTELIGGLGNKTRAELQEAQIALDGAGIARKELPPTDPVDEQQVQDTDTPAEPDGDMLKKLALKMAADLMVSLKDDWQAMTEEKLAAALESVMGMPPDAPTPEAVAEDETETEENEDMSDQKSLAAEERKAYADTFQSMTKDMSDIAKSFTTAMEQNATAQKGIMDVVNKLTVELAALKEQVNGRPRIASQAAETTIDPTSEAGKALASAIEKSTNGNGQTFMGVAVKNQPK